MKKISVVCKPTGFAIVSTSDINIENETGATELEIDYSETAYTDKPKWVDLIMADGTSLRYDLGDAPVVSMTLEYANTIKGEMTITPFIYDGVIKAKYKTNATIMIHQQKEAGTSGVVVRDDFIFELKQKIDELEQRIIALEEI